MASEPASESDAAPATVPNVTLSLSAEQARFLKNLLDKHRDEIPDVVANVLVESEHRSQIKDRELKSETFSDALGRACRTYCRSWYLGIGVSLMIMIGWFYGIGTSVVCLILLVFLGIGVVFINWLREDTEDKLRALQPLLLVLILSPFVNQLFKQRNPNPYGPQNPNRATVHNQTSPNGGSGHSSGQRADSAFHKMELQPGAKQTLEYWQTGVADFHQLRFSSPRGDEPTDKYLEHVFQNLQRLVDRARSTSTVFVDQELVAMARKHFAIEDQMIQMKQRADELMKQEGIVSDGDTIGERAAQWQNIVAMAQANPAMVDKLPEEARRLFQDVVELEQKRLDQLREIEIMQAVLQERWRVIFPLPLIAQ